MADIPQFPHVYRHVFFILYVVYEKGGAKLAPIGKLPPLPDSWAMPVEAHKPIPARPSDSGNAIARAIAFCIICWGLSFIISAVRWW